jgi:PAT family beta-lactamase induction signal transducer AmpG
VARSTRKLLWTSTTNFGEGLPWSFMHQVAMEFLVTIGVSKTEISSTSLLHIPGFIRFSWSPAVDIYGKKRRLVWALQLMMAAVMFAVTVTVPGRHLRAFWATLTVLAFLLAVHDTVCDGFYLQALDKHDQEIYSGTRQAAYKAATWVGRSALVMLAGWTAWKWSFGGAAALMVVVALVNGFVMPHPPDVHPQDRAPARGGHLSSGAAFLAAYRSFLTQPQAVRVLAFILLFRLGDIMMFAMSSAMLKDIGIGTVARGALSGYGIPAFMVGAILGGLLVARYGLPRCLVPMIFFQNLMILLYVLVAKDKPSYSGVLVVVLLEQFASGIGSSAYAVFMMKRVRSAYAASHFAFATSLISLTGALSGFISGPINDRVGNVWFFVIAFLASVPGLVLAFFVPKTDVEPETAKPA